MSVQFKIADQVLKMSDTDNQVADTIAKYSAFLAAMSSDGYKFQREAVATALRFLLSAKYVDLEALARENFHASPQIAQRHDNVDAFLDRMPLRKVKSASLDLATGTGKSFVMYSIAAIALAEGIADRVLVLCPSLTIEEELIEKFQMLAGNAELVGIMRDLDAQVVIPAIGTGRDTVHTKMICIENIHAVYENTGSSIRDSFRGVGSRSLVLNDEAHHLFSGGGGDPKKWMEFLTDTNFGFNKIINVTGTPYTDDNYFCDVIFRFGLKDAIESGVVKKPDYKKEETFKKNSWEKTYSFHQHNVAKYGDQIKPISIVVTQEIATCVEVYRELIDFLMEKEGISKEEAESKAIWVTSSVPTTGNAGDRVKAAYGPRDDKDSADKRRKENLVSLKQVDVPGNPIEWIVSVSMLTEGWDVKNVFQVVPHESRAFSSKLLISQVLGRGLRVPAGMDEQPVLLINNHEAWSEPIERILREVLEVEDRLTWGFDERRKSFSFPIFNLNYEAKQTSVEQKREAASDPQVSFEKQARETTHYSTFKHTGTLTASIADKELLELEDAVKALRLFLKLKDEKIAAKWTKARIRDCIVEGLKKAGQDTTFLSRENYLRMQQAFGPLFRELNVEHPRLSQVADSLVSVDLSTTPRQSFSENLLKEHGTLYTVDGDTLPFTGDEKVLWERYQKLLGMWQQYESDASDDAKAIGPRLQVVPQERFKTPWNAHFVTHEPERQFSDLLFVNVERFDGVVKIPNVGVYSFPYSYKPMGKGRSHVTNDRFNPDFFLKVAGKNEVIVVEIKSDGDDAYRNRAKCRDGLKHFAELNEALVRAGETWRYTFLFLSPSDFPEFFDAVRSGTYTSWQSGLMLKLLGGDAE
jgi:type III restriction enzyme